MESWAGERATSTRWSETHRLPAKWGQCTNAFYDPKLNAHFFHVAGDSDDNGVIWVYRYGPGKP